jgi:Tat protein secretion system quality control protein TatD with DNase activity
MNVLVDTHTHLGDPQFDADREEVLARAAAAGVTRLIEIADEPEEWERAITLARAHPDRIRSALGLHPYYADRFDAFHLYDMDFSLACHRAGWRVGIAQDLHLLHDSLGNFDERWSDYADRFVRKHNLVVAAPHQDPTHGVAVDSIERIAPLFDAINAA